MCFIDLLYAIEGFGAPSPRDAQSRYRQTRIKIFEVSNINAVLVRKFESDKLQN